MGIIIDETQESHVKIHLKLLLLLLKKFDLKIINLV